MIKDEVVMVVGLRIEHHSTFGEKDLPKQPLVHEQIEGVVDRRPRHVREALPHAGPYLIGRGMLVGVQDVLRHRHPLGRRIDLVVPQK